MRFELPRARGRTCSPSAVANRLCVMLPKQAKSLSRVLKCFGGIFGSAFWEGVQFCICLAFPVVPLVLCCNAQLQVVLLCSLSIFHCCFHFVFSHIQFRCLLCKFSFILHATMSLFTIVTCLNLNINTISCWRPAHPSALFCCFSLEPHLVYSKPSMWRFNHLLASYSLQDACFKLQNLK